MRKSLAKRLENEQQRYADAIGDIANERVADFICWWRKSRNGVISLYFGMGSMSASVDGKHYDQFTSKGWCKELHELDRDIDEITNSHRIAVPDDVTSEIQEIN